MKGRTSRKQVIKYLKNVFKSYKGNTHSLYEHDCAYACRKAYEELEKIERTKTK